MVEIWRKVFFQHLSKAVSNVKGKGNGAHIYQAEVIPTRLDLERVGMHYSISALFDDEVLNREMFSYKIKIGSFEKKVAGLQKLAIGMVSIKSLRTHSNRNYGFAVLYFGQHQILGNILEDMDSATYQTMRNGILEAFRDGRIGDVIGSMQSYFGPQKYTIWHLFRDEKRRVMDEIMRESMIKVEQSFRRIYDNDYQLLSALKKDNIPIPTAYRSTIEFVLNTDLIRFLKESDNNLAEIHQLLDEFRKWGVKLDERQYFDHFAGERIYKELLRIQSNIEDIELYKRLNEFFGLIKGFAIKPNLDKSQNVYFNMAQNQVLIDDSILDDKDWQEQFGLLGKNLKVRMEDDVLNRKYLSHSN